jgi:hypothetical protein
VQRSAKTDQNACRQQDGPTKGRRRRQHQAIGADGTKPEQQDVQGIETSPLADLQIYWVQSQKQRREDRREVACDRAGPQEGQNHKDGTGDQGRQAGDDKSLP